MFAAAVRADYPFLNELHYDNAGTDVGELVEIAGPAGLALSGWSIVLYNGATGEAYATYTVEGTLPDEENGFGAVGVALGSNAIQNGAPDGLALVDPGGAAVELISYEGSFTAVDGPAAGRPAQEMGVAEPATTPPGFSLQRVGIGVSAEHFHWAGPAPASAGSLNPGQRMLPEARRSLPEIQGAAHVSPHRGELVVATGVVTRIYADGFALQDPFGDARPETSDAVFVHLGEPPDSTLPEVSLGDGVELHARVAELPGAPDELSVTELGEVSALAVLESGVALPAPRPVGGSGARPPSRVVDDDGLAVFEPRADAIDFYESLEGMRVTLVDAVAVGLSNRFGELPVVVDAGEGATHLARRGALAVTADDPQPERIRVCAPPAPIPPLPIAVGDGLGDVTGILGYAFGSYELVATAPLAVEPGELAPEVTALTGGRGLLTVASFNVENLSPAEDERLARLGHQIVDALGAPDLIGLQEIQDDDGPADTGNVDATGTYLALVSAVRDAGGPPYDFVDLPPMDGGDGGAPGANIRVGWLFRPDRLALVPGSARRLADPDPTDGDAFAGSRKPLAIELVFAGRTLLAINNHFTSRLGGSPLFGSRQPPRIGGRQARVAQATALRAHVSDRLASDPGALVIVLGDLNARGFDPPLAVLTAGGLLEDAAAPHPPRERYTFVFEGAAQQLDHVLVSRELAEGALLDLVHGNAELPGAASDHDPVLVRLRVPEPGRGLQGFAPAVVLCALLRRRAADPAARRGRRRPSR